VAQRRLRRRRPCDGHAIRAGADVIEADLLAKTDAGGIAAMFAADAQLDARARRPAPLRREVDELADALDIQCDERVGGKNTLFDIGREEARGVVTADADGGLRQSLVPKLKNSVLPAMSPAIDRVKRLLARMAKCPATHSTSILAQRCYCGRFAKLRQTDGGNDAILSGAKHMIELSALNIASVTGGASPAPASILDIRLPNGETLEEFNRRRAQEIMGTAGGFGGRG
jgi:hypothetical protein